MEVKNSVREKRYKVFISNTVGCESTRSEGDRTINFLKMNGHEIIGDPTKAEYLVINTCTFLESHRINLYRELRNLTKKSPHAKLIIIGCARDISSELLSDFKTEICCGHYDLEKLDSIFTNQIRFNEIPRFTFDNNLKKTVIVICRGCMGSCTYCSIKHSIGAVRSRKPEEIIEDIEIALSQGEKHFVITGDDIGSYGHDINSDLPILLRKISKIKGNFKVLLGNIHPKWISIYIDEIVSFLKTNKANKWIFFPIQSANNYVLKTMGRGYTIEECIKSIEKLKKIDGLKFYYDIIIGFPTETDSAFMDTVQFILNCTPSDIMIAIYSPEKVTPAYQLPPLNKNKLKKRHEVLIKAWRALQYLLKKSNPELFCRWGT